MVNVLEVEREEEREQNCCKIQAREHAAARCVNAALGA
jgi:hypothetical protein